MTVQRKLPLLFWAVFWLTTAVLAANTLPPRHADAKRPLSPASCPPDVTFTEVPPMGSTDNLRGTVTCADPAAHAIVVYINVGDSWWIKPTFTQPVTSIQPDGTWSANVTTGGIDHLANMLIAFLIPATYEPPLMGGGASLPPELYANSLVFESVLRFSGYRWTVKQSSAPVGPGPNLFSARPEDVWIDADGRLHLTIVQRDGQWHSTEVYTRASLGVGTYIFKTTGPVDRLDPNVVLGLFTWDNDASANHYREIDVEFSRWGNAENPNNAQFVVQPWDTPGNLYPFAAAYTADKGTHAFAWHSRFIRFSSGSGHTYPPAPSDVVASWSYTNTASIPPDGPAQARINLWLMQGSAPTDNHSVEIIVDAFEFQPWRGYFLPFILRAP